MSPIQDLRWQLVGARIRQLREERRLTQEELVARMQVAGHSSLSQPRQSEVEKGIREVSLLEAVSYAQIFGVAVADLIPDDLV